MGEETTWFDFLPGIHNLRTWAAHLLGRENAEQGFSQHFFYRWQMFSESHFTLAHVLGALLVLLFVIFGGITFRRAVAAGGEAAIVPPARFGLRNLFELFTDAVFSMMEGVMGRHNAERFLPFIGALAVFIFFSNALALIPGFIPPTSMIKTNLALALAVFLVTHIYGVKEHGIAYFKHFLGPIVKWYALPLMGVMLVIELISHIARPVSLTLRLMGNMASDHKVVAAFFMAVPLLVPVPFLILGVLVAIVQTLVFCLLTMVYIQGAVAHEEH